MSVINISTPDGKTLEVNAPDGATPDQIHQAALSATEHYKSQMQSIGQDPLSMAAVKEGVSGPKAFWSKGLTLPERATGEAFKRLGAMLPSQPPPPTGNLLTDVVKGTPSAIRPSVEMAGKVVPPFLSRASLLTAGAAPLITKGVGVGLKYAGALGSKIASQAEEMSGIAPKAAGALEEAATNPSIWFQKGVKQAGKLYGKAKELAGSTTRLTTKLASKLKSVPDNHDVVSKAFQIIESGGDLNPSEAQLARKSVDNLWRSRQYPKEVIESLRNLFDKIVKSDKGMSAADADFARSIKADAIRNIFPQNKYGGASAFKTLLLFFGNLGKSPTKAIADVTALSPAAQGLTATALGAGARTVGALAETPAAVVGARKIPGQLMDAWGNRNR